MTINKIKEAMLAYTDFYGGDLSKTDSISSAKTEKDLKDIIQSHSDFLDDMRSDAQSHLDHLRTRLGLDII